MMTNECLVVEREGRAFSMRDVRFEVDMFL